MLIYFSMVRNYMPIHWYMEPGLYLNEVTLKQNYGKYESFSVKLNRRNHEFYHVVELVVKQLAKEANLGRTKVSRMNGQVYKLPNVLDLLSTT